MRTLAEILTAICNFVMILYFMSIIATVFVEPSNRFFPHHVILTFAVFWTITQAVSYASYEQLTEDK